MSVTAGALEESRFRVRRHVLWRPLSWIIASASALARSWQSHIDVEGAEMEYITTTGRRSNSWKQRTRHVRKGDVLFTVLALVSTGCIGYLLVVVLRGP